jgi:hypothetical protein
MIKFPDHLKFWQNRHFKYGLPFITLLLGATYALPLVTSFRYEFRKTKGLSAEDILKLQEKGIIRKNPEHLTLEQLHDEYKDKFNLEDYENLRIPKPWDNDETKLDQSRTSNKKLKSVKETRLIPDPE